MKRILAGAFASFPAPVSNWLAAGYCPIFVLHRVAENPTAPGQSVQHVEACLGLARRYGFTPLSLATLADTWVRDVPLPPKPVVFTIDDGFADHAEIAGDLFARYDVPLTCFVVTGLLDGELWPWDDQVAWAMRVAAMREFEFALPNGKPWKVVLSPTNVRQTVYDLRAALKAMDQGGLYEWLPSFFSALGLDQQVSPPHSHRAMTWSQARAFVRQGHTIAPHSCSHRILSRLSDGQARQEVKNSIARVHAEVGEAPRLFAYPTGRDTDFRAREQQYLRQEGIVCAVSTQTRTARSGDNLLALPRFALPDTAADFLQYLSCLEVLKSRVRW
jgi:peptidoglycan/xylan/chitin deacetylase (PgdA/CDA1 family)